VTASPITFTNVVNPASREIILVDHLPVKPEIRFALNAFTTPRSGIPGQPPVR
jgi:hypothetical protein